MEETNTRPTVLITHVALPQDHGSWVFLLSPLLIGLFAGGSWSMATPLLIVGSLSAFLIRQPITTLVKILSGRRNKRDVLAAWFWTVTYGIIGLVCLVGLIAMGFQYLLWLVLPGIPVFIWHLFLVSRRAERRQMGVELIATGVLSLAAPAAYWIGTGTPDAMGWWLFLLTWLQSAASIVYAYLRLEQRNLKEVPELSARMKSGRRAWAYATFNILFSLSLGITGVIPKTAFIPFSLQWMETNWGIFNPAIGWRPTKIGLRQLIVSSIFTLLFIVVW